MGTYIGGSNWRPTLWIATHRATRLGREPLRREPVSDLRRVDDSGVEPELEHPQDGGEDGLDEKTVEADEEAPFAPGEGGAGLGGRHGGDARGRAVRIPPTT